VADLQGFKRNGLTGGNVPATLLQGSYLHGHTFGWTQFEIAPGSATLTVTTYGVPAYDSAALDTDSQAVLVLTPQIIGQFRIDAIM
jgi:hypothetical protein